jgi:hypothetical protein
MGTVIFEPTTVKNTRFFSLVVASLTTGSTSTVSNATGFTQVLMYTGETVKTTAQVTLRGFEIYKDLDADGEYTGLCTVTYDVLNTAADIYISVKPVVGDVGNTIDITFKNQTGSTQNFKIVYVCEDV